MPIRLDGKHVVITGAGGALGSAVLEAFILAGASCHVPTREHDVPARDNVRVVPGVNLTDERAVSTFFAGCPSLWASVHVAGGFAMKPFVNTTLADLHAQLDINLVTAFLCCREALKRMLGGPEGGRIVNVGSRAALVPGGGAIAYSAAKGAMTVMTQALAEEVRGSGVLVNAVAPFTIDTPANRAAMPKADFSKWTPPRDLAQTILWLASTENRATTGVILPAYGS